MDESLLLLDLVPDFRGMGLNPRSESQVPLWNIRSSQKPADRNRVIFSDDGSGLESQTRLVDTRDY